MSDAFGAALVVVFEEMEPAVVVQVRECVGGEVVAAEKSSLEWRWTVVSEERIGSGRDAGSRTEVAVWSDADESELEYC